MPPARAAFAEFIGAFALMFVGGGAIIVTGGENLIAIALAHGLILAIMVSATLHISGGQFNPAVSVALGVIKKQPWAQTGVFIASQLLGAAVAAALLLVLTGTLQVEGSDMAVVDKVKLGATLGAMDLDAGRVLVLEIIATFFLMFAIMGTAVDNRGVGKSATVGGFAIGLTVTADILCFGPLTGASMNPSRSFGPQLVGGLAGMEGVGQMWWVYWVAPVIGALLAAVSYHVVFGSGTADDER